MQARHTKSFKLLLATAGSLAARRFSARRVAVLAVVACTATAAPVLADSPPSQPPPVTLPSASVSAEETQLPSDQLMVKTLAQFEADETEEREALESQASILERQGSQIQYGEAVPSEAEQLLTASFASQLQTLNAEPARFFSGARLIRPLGQGGALLESDGRKELIEGTAPVLVPGTEGAPSKINLTLEETGGAYEPANPLVPLSIPTTASEAVEVGEEGLEVAQAGANESVARPFGQMNVFYPEVATDTDLLVSPTATGVEFFDQLRSEDSPETFRFHVQMPQGAELRSDATGAEVVTAAGSKLAEVLPPNAVDGQGTEVPVRMTTEGDSLVIDLEESEKEFAYPILVDPIIQEWYWQNWNEGYNLQALSNGAWHWNTSEGAQSSYVYGSTSCIYTCWGSHRGLYMDTPNGNLPANRWGQWSYSAPNSETYLENAWVSPYWRDNHVNCSQSQYGQPYDYDGMWNESSWNRILYNQANDQGWSDLESWGRALIIGMGTSSGISIPCWRDVMAGGVRIWLEDWSRPYLTTSSSGQWMDQSPLRLNVSSYDSGLGVQKFRATATNVTGGTEEWWTANSCSGLYKAPCPHTWNLGEGSQPQLSYSPANLPEGIDTLSVTAYDAVEKPSFTTNEMTVRVDHTAPTINLSGTLTEQSKFGTERPSYTIAAEALDGDPTSNEGSKARSGVTKLEIETDGKAVTAPFTPKCAGEPNCGAEEELEVPARELALGAHVLTVKATDAYGHVATKKSYFSITADKTAPTLTVSGMPPFPKPNYATAAGSYGSGQGQFEYTHGVAIDPEGDIWVADVGNSRVEEFNPSGEYLGQFGSYGSGKGELSEPSGLAIDQKGDIWVADWGNDRVEEFNASGEYLSQFGSTGSGPGHFNAPVDLAIDSEGNLWVVDREDSRVEEFNASGEYLSQFGSLGSGSGQLRFPSGIAIDPEGAIWVVDRRNNRVEEFNAAGEYLSQFGSPGYEIGQLSEPTGLTIDSEGNLWVVDFANSRVEEFSTKGEYLRQFGSPGNGTGKFSQPIDIAFDSVGNAWVSDSGNNRIQKWTIPKPAVGTQLEPISVSAGDAGFGVTSVAVKLRNEAYETETLEQGNQTCPKGACDFNTAFGALDLSERPFGNYTMIIEAEDGAGNVSDASREIVLDPSPPKISLSGALAERAGQPLGAPSGELSINATESDLPTSGVKAINIELDHQRVASHSFDCSSNCEEVEVSYTYDAQRDGPERSLQAAAIPGGSTLTSLSGVSCATTSDCQAAGHYTDSGGTIVTLAEHWDGTEWTVESSPNPAGALESRLEGVSCASASSCTAVGYYKTGTEAFSSFAERWNGTAWSLTSIANPVGFAEVYLYGVSCGASTDCWGVGRVDPSESQALEGKETSALLEHWNGSAWAQVAVTGAPTQLKAISCPSTSSCTAVSGLSGLAVESWDGTSWISQSLASPNGGSGPTMMGVSCSAASACTVAGSYTTGGHSAPLVERWDGSSWAVQATPDPVGVVEEATSSNLEGVSCPSASACTAVGVRHTSDETMPLVESWDGSEWALQPPAIPSGTESASLVSLGCSASFECTAVGSHVSTGTQALIEHEGGNGGGDHTLTVEAVDKYGDAESMSIAVDVPKEISKTPDCSENAKVSLSGGVMSADEAVAAIKASAPTALAPSIPTTEEMSGEQIDPSYSSPDPNLRAEGSLVENETSVNPLGGIILKGVACITPAETTNAATEATLVNGDAAVFANTAADTQTLTRPTAAGTAVVQTITGGNAPTSYSWNVSLNADEKLIELPSGAAAITRPTSDGDGEVKALEKPEAAESLESLNDAASQLEVALYEDIQAESETPEEVVAIIGSPWVVLRQESIIPLELKVEPDKEVPTEFTLTYIMPPFEPNFTPEEVVWEAVGGNGGAAASAIIDRGCHSASPCGSFDFSQAAGYAEYFGSEAHPRNTYYHDFGDNNCTNFVSQILARGGMSFMRAYEHGTGSWWYKRYGFPQYPEAKRPAEWTESWVEADLLPRHLWQYGLANLDSSNQPAGWTRGDILAEDWYGTNGPGDFNHLQFVVSTYVTAGGGRLPLVANESDPGKNYGRRPWPKVKEDIEEVEGHEWNRVPLMIHAAYANADEAVAGRTPANLYGPGGIGG